NEVEVIVQGLLLGPLHVGIARLLIVPGLIGFTRLHGGENVRQAWMSAAAVDDLLDAVFLAEAFAFPDEFDAQAVFLGNRLCIAPNDVLQRQHEMLVIKDADRVSIEKASHALRIAQRMQISKDNDPIIAVQNTMQVRCIFLGQKLGGHRSTPWMAWLSKCASTLQLTQVVTLLVPACPG